MTKTVVLSLEGGALKGIIQLKILETLNKIIGDKCNIRKIFKDKFCEALSKVFNLTKETISDNLSYVGQDGFYMAKVVGKDILDALYDNFWDKSSDDINPDIKVSYSTTLLNFLGGLNLLKTGEPSNSISKTFFNVRDQMKNAIEGKSLMDGDKCNIRKIFKDKFCEALSKVLNLTKETISDDLSYVDQNGDYMEKVVGKDILDALYDNFWDKSSDDINPDTKVSDSTTLLNFLGGLNLLKAGEASNSIFKTFFNVRDQIKNAIEGKSLMDFIDVVGGVSIGSVIATALLLKDENGGYKYSISDCIEMLNTFPEKFFEKNWMPFFQPVLKGDKALEGFKELFGKKSTFNDLVGDKKLLILSTNLDTCKNTIWTNLVDSESWDENFKTDSSLKDIRYVDVSDVKLYDAVNSSSSYLMALPAHEVQYKLLGENESKDRTEADGCYINVTPHLDLLSTLSATGTKIEDIIMIGVGTGRCDFDGTNVASGSPYSYVKDILSDQNFNSGAIEARQDNTSRAVDNIIRINAGSSYLFDVPMIEYQYKNSFDTTLIPQYIEIAEEYCEEHMIELEALANELMNN